MYNTKLLNRLIRQKYFDHIATFQDFITGCFLAVSGDVFLSEHLVDKGRRCLIQVFHHVFI